MTVWHRVWRVLGWVVLGVLGLAVLAAIVVGTNYLSNAGRS